EVLTGRVEVVGETERALPADGVDAALRGRSVAERARVCGVGGRAARRGARGGGGVRARARLLASTAGREHGERNDQPARERDPKHLSHAEFSFLGGLFL